MDNMQPLQLLGLRWVLLEAVHAGVGRPRRSRRSR